MGRKLLVLGILLVLVGSLLPLGVAAKGNDEWEHPLVNVELKCVGQGIQVKVFLKNPEDLAMTADFIYRDLVTGEILMQEEGKEIGPGQTLQWTTVLHNVDHLDSTNVHAHLQLRPNWGYTLGYSPDSCDCR